MSSEVSLQKYLKGIASPALGFLGAKEKKERGLVSRSHFPGS